jgi:two-component system nitrogen regulation sensor histidine kinase NtrY
MSSETAIDFIVHDELKSSLMIDKVLMTQVLINVVKNALEATRAIENPKIVITVGRAAEQTYIEVVDNGPGVAAHAIQEIFVPFYTTKAEGSGIGLALSRKIVSAHGGLLAYRRIKEKTCFTINLPQTI